MKFSTTITAVTMALASPPTVAAWPGMAQKIKTLQQRAQASSFSDSFELIGDLAHLSPVDLTPVGARVHNILTGVESAESDEIFYNVPPLNSAPCAQDTCCVWWYIVDEMVRLFSSPSGRCTNAARGAIRLGFHDASAYSKRHGGRGGADGSIVLAREERERPLNKGLQEIIKRVEGWHERWGGYGISMADLIQMAATVGTVVCPLGPRIRTFVGRRDSNIPSPDGLLPSVNFDADQLIDLFLDKTIQPHGLAALLGAHSVSQQRFVDPSRKGDPQDSTPGVLDTAFYSETFGQAPPRVFKFRSDIVLSEDPRVFPAFRGFVGEQGQGPWRAAFAREYVRLSLLGVYNINNLTDCTWVLPAAVVGPQPGIGGRGNWADDQWAVDMWLNTTVNIPEITNILGKGEFVSAMVDLVRIPEAYETNGTTAGEVQQVEKKKDAGKPKTDAADKDTKKDVGEKKKEVETKAAGEAKKDVGKTKGPANVTETAGANKTTVPARELLPGQLWRA